MSGPGYQEGGEPVWWWRVAQHLDTTQRALANAMAHNVEDPTLANMLYDRLREGQAILLEIFRAKGLLPSMPIARSEAPIPVAPATETAAPSMPTGVLLPFPSQLFPSSVSTEAASAPVEEPAVLEADQEALASEVKTADEGETPAVTAAAADAAVAVAASDTPVESSAAPGIEERQQ